MLKNNRTLILIGLGVADLLGAIDSTSVTVALPTITRDLHLSVTAAQWIVTSYTLMLVAVLIVAGKLGDVVGHKKVYLWGLGLFGGTSLLLSFIHNPIALILLRGMQGCGTAILYTMPMAIITRLWQEREKAFAVTASFFAAGTLLGPMIGGLLTQLHVGPFYGWQLIFLLNVPIIALGIVIVDRVLPALPTADSHDRIRFGRVAGMVAALGFSVCIMTMAPGAYRLLGVLLLVLWYLFDRQVKGSLIDYSLFADKNFSAANGVSFFAMVAMMGMLFVLTYLLQEARGWSAEATGFAMLPVPLVTVVFASLGSRITNWRTGALLSSILVVFGVLLMIFIGPSTSYYTGILPSLLSIAAGSGILMTVMFAAIMGSAPVVKAGSASGVMNMLQQLGTIIGTALVSPLVFSYHRAFILLFIISLFGAACAFAVDARASQRVAEKIR